MAKLNRLFAIRVGPCIEFRAAAKAPRALVSRWKRQIMGFKRRDVYNPALSYPHSHYVEIPKKVTFKQTIYLGGRVLGTVNVSEFKAFTTGVPVPAAHEMVEVVGANAQSLLNPRVRRELEIR